MAIALTNYAAEKAANHFIDDTTWTPATTLYVAVLKSASTASDDTNTHASKEIETPGQNGYARQAISWTAASGNGVLVNSADIEFGALTASDPSAATDVWLVDSSITLNGNIWAYGTVVASKDPAQNDKLIIPAGSLALTWA